MTDAERIAQYKAKAYGDIKEVGEAFRRNVDKLPVGECATTVRLLQNIETVIDNLETICKSYMKYVAYADPGFDGEIVNSLDKIDED